MANWIVKSKKANFKDIMKTHKVSEVLARLLANRGLEKDEEIKRFLYPSIEALHDPMGLKDMEKACLILEDKILHNKKIRIVGDYDVDGISATFILYTGLIKCGANVDYEIPDRIKDGYGINDNIIKQAFDDGVDTILTCDNGITAFDQTIMAKDMGMTLIITDHHEIATKEIKGNKIENIPLADAIINPKQSKCTYPNKKLCGAAVAFKLIQSLYKVYGFEKEIYPLLEVVAIATVCDVMDLVEENRILVKLGLESLGKSKNQGLNALMDLSDINTEKLSAYHLGFIIGPCLNASGRLDTAKKGLKLLLVETEEEAYKMAKELKELNDVRKDMTQKGVEQAKELIETTELRHDKILVVYLVDCHESIAGIIAGRIREYYNKPTFILTKGEDSVKGSGRSIESYNMFMELEKSSEYLIKFGGHPMAAGLSIEEKDISSFRKNLNDLTTLTDEDLIAKVTIDVVLPLGYISKELVEELNILEPFGKGNPKPVFAERDVSVTRAFLLGKNKNVLKFNIINKHGKRMDAMYFSDVESLLDDLRNKFGEDEVDKMFKNLENNIQFNIIYYPNINEYNGRRNLQIIINNYLLT